MYPIISAMINRVPGMLKINSHSLDMIEIVSTDIVLVHFLSMSGAGFAGQCCIEEWLQLLLYFNFAEFLFVDIYIILDYV